MVFPVQGFQYNHRSWTNTHSGELMESILTLLVLACFMHHHHQLAYGDCNADIYIKYTTTTISKAG